MLNNYRLVALCVVFWTVSTQANAFHDHFLRYRRTRPRAQFRTLPHFLIRPGVGIGQITIGMNERDAAVARHLTPVRTAHVAGGIVVESWLSKAPSPPHIVDQKSLLCDYLTVFFQRGMVVQIEVSSESFYTESGLTTANSPDSFRKAYPDYRTQEFQRLITHDNSYSLPAPKHDVAYDDAISSGIAWKYGAWGAMGPEPDPTMPLESVIVHSRGRKVIFDPFDSLPYSGTWPLTK